MGQIIIMLEEYRKAHGFSKYSIINNCGLSATQLNSYCNNKITRVDLPVLARICDCLGCEVADLLEYVPDDKEKKHEHDIDV